MFGAYACYECCEADICIGRSNADGSDKECPGSFSWNSRGIPTCKQYGLTYEYCAPAEKFCDIVSGCKSRIAWFETVGAKDPCNPVECREESIQSNVANMLNPEIPHKEGIGYRVVDDSKCPGTKPASKSGYNKQLCEEQQSKKTVGSCTSHSDCSSDTCACDVPDCSTRSCCKATPSYNYGDNCWHCNSGDGECSTCNDGYEKAVKSHVSSHCVPVTTYPPSYTYSYSTGSWGSCSASCGGGTQTRSVTCKRSDGQSANFASTCSGSKPSTTQSCNTQTCALDTINVATFDQLVDAIHDKNSGPSTLRITNHIVWPTDGSVPQYGIKLRYPVRIVGACSSTSSLVASGTVAAGTCVLDAKEMGRHFYVTTTQYSTAEVVFEKLALVNGKHNPSSGWTSHGGAVLAEYAGATRFEDVIFKDNTVRDEGGAVYATRSGKATFTSCRFLGNKAEGPPTGSFRVPSELRHLQQSELRHHGLGSTLFLVRYLP
ncbi:papilin [Pycnococcus provasolii]